MARECQKLAAIRELKKKYFAPVTSTLNSEEERTTVPAYLDVDYLPDAFKKDSSASVGFMAKRVESDSEPALQKPAFSNYS